MQDLCEELHIPYTYTSKLFYNEYHTRIIIGLPDEMLTENQEARAKIRDKVRKRYSKQTSVLVSLRKKFRTSRFEFAQELIHRYNLVDIGVRYNERSISFFSNDISFENIIKNENVIQYSFPHNAADISLMVSITGTNKVLRKQLFNNGKYRFRVAVLRRHLPDFNEYIIQNMDEGDFEIKVKNLYPTIFLKNEDDLAMLRVAMGEHIEDIKEAILL